MRNTYLNSYIGCYNRQVPNSTLYLVKNYFAFVHWPIRGHKRGQDGEQAALAVLRGLYVL
ncbi:expressed protein [Arabidopsis lyrata subsp. lyrata]|uniref:Expressed protein n=1 Tax=Arabidopsis lyrata subsp. lyrata TaxID=81972 RepID=D7LZH3_ARALL|nr:expressed protein [Arabidopsis lyrata subsp. lyrata]